MFVCSSGKEGANLGLGLPAPWPWQGVIRRLTAARAAACLGRPRPVGFSHDTLPDDHLVKGVALPEPRLIAPHPGALFQNKNLDWFPRMRAMSLVSGEGEGEQNEIRILQEKLGSTMKLVSHLTAQLNELKEQVCSQASLGVPSFCTMWGRSHRRHREPWFRLRLASRWSFVQQPGRNLLSYSGSYPV